MSSAFNKQLPLDFWTPCYPLSEMQAERKSDGFHVTTLGKNGAYAVKYPLLKAWLADEYVFEISYRLESGDLAFGALSEDESRWLGQSSAAVSRGGRWVKTFSLQLAAGQKFVLLVANSHAGGDLASSFVIEALNLPGVKDDAISFASKDGPEGHHRVFYDFPCPNISVPAGASAYFVGTIFRDSLLSGRESSSPARAVSTAYPAFNDEYFEWIALLSAVRAAEGEFTMIELGAGYGRWLLLGAGAARRRNLRFKLIGVEAEPDHFKWMEMCFRDNGIDPADHQLIEAAISGTEEEVWFHVGQAAEWYGQHIALPSEKAADAVPGGAPEEKKFRKVRAISLDSLLRPLASVDLIDLDIQGAEADVLAASVEQLNAKVKMVTVGTHINPITYTREIEEAVTALFTKMNWIMVYSFSLGGESDTPYGRMKFEDGVQVWVNPKATKVLEVIRHS